MAEIPNLKERLIGEDVGILSNNIGNFMQDNLEISHPNLKCMLLDLAISLLRIFIVCR